MHGHNVDSSKPKDFKKSMSKFIRYCKPYFLAISISLIISMLSAILTIIGPDRLKVMANVISDGIKDGIDLNKVKIIAISLVLIYLASAVFGYLDEIIMAMVTNKFSKVLRRDITKKINKMPLSYFDKHAYGDVLSRITNDVDTLGQGLNQSLSTIVASLTLLLGSILMMFITNYIMAITAIVSSLFGFLFMGIVISKSQKYFDLLQKELGNLNGHIEEVYSGHNVVRVYNGVNKANEEFDIINKFLAENVQKSQFLSELMHPFMGFIGNFSYVCVCIVGSILAIKGIISFGVIVAFIMYVRLFNQPLSRLAQSATSLQSCAAASERVFEFLDEEEMSSERNITKKLDKNKVKGEIEFKHVKFSYDNEKEVIKDFNAKVKPGEKIAIVGPTGAGKTTMVNLLMKFYDIKEGDILIDGISTKELSRENIHDLFIMVLQDTWVFEGTIKENVRYNSKGITDKDIIDTCKTVGLHHFIKTLPDGYDTLLSDNETLSSGQKQLLTIARGLLEKAPFLILDEATSSVDTRTEELVSKAMDKLMEGRTSFIIAHRLSTIKNADLILMMDEGNIVEVGTHKELLKLNGRYAELYNSQFEKIEDL